MNQVAAEIRCFHCEKPLGSDVRRVTVAGETRLFCGADCHDAAARIHELDLENYYTYRDKFDASEPEPGCCKQRAAREAAANRATRRMEFAVVDRAEGSHRVIALHVPDIRCAACTWLIESSLVKRDDVLRVRTVLADRAVTVDYKGDDPLDIVEFIEGLGFTVVPDRGAHVREAQSRERKSMLSRLGVAGIGMMQVMMYAIATYVAGEDGIEPAYRSLMHWASLAVTTPIVLYSAMPFHRGAIRDLRHFSPGMDVPVSLAISAAWVLSVFNTVIGDGHVYFDSVAMFTFLLLIGRFVELSSRQRFDRSRMLAESLMPAAAVDAETGEPVDIGSLAPGMRLAVAAGETIPADGIIETGSTSVDEAAFTGESMPVPKSPGTRVYAGALNLDGDIIVRVDVPLADFVINRISTLYREAATWRPRFATASDQAARWFVSAILVLAAGSGIYWYLASGDGFTVALTVLVVSCPCALSLATPVAYTVALSTLRNAGVVVGNGQFLERLANVSRIVFDKTGTLTRGRLRLEEVRLNADLTEARVLEIAGALEQESRHPIAQAFDGGVGIVVSDREILPGEGVAGTIEGARYRLGKPADTAERPDAESMWIVLECDGQSVAFFRLRDEVRAESADVVRSLRGIAQVSLLTGDGSAEGARLGSELCIDDVRIGQSPADKIEAVRAMQAEGDIVLMAGDGINDAGSMSTADASLAVSPADILVQEAADATMLAADLRGIPATIAFARRVRRIIRQNVFWAIAYNLSVIPLAVTGMITPWMAALGMSASSVLVVANANRLAKGTEWKSSSS